MEHSVRSIAAPRPLEEPRRVTILGSTGSIGCNTVDIIAANRSAFLVEALTANTNVTELARQARMLSARVAVIGDGNHYSALKDALAGTGIETQAGADAIAEAAMRPSDVVMASIVGAAGLKPTLEAVRRGGVIALANKECLVTAGQYFMKEVRRSNASLIPVDSEHSAIFQALDSSNPEQLERIILTASGGPFRTWPAQRMAEATPKEALNHPNWKMGAKLTIDSATMMNKGLEVIEAHHLFGVGADQISVLVHPQSVVHSMVEYADGSVLAQLGTPDMRMPISYALAWPKRMAVAAERLDLGKIGALTFEAVDEKRFPAVGLCISCLESATGAATVLNAANEIAVAAFLAGRISFDAIVKIVESCLDLAEKDGNIQTMSSLDEICALDTLARHQAGREISALTRI